MTGSGFFGHFSISPLFLPATFFSCASRQWAELASEKQRGRENRIKSKSHLVGRKEGTKHVGARSTCCRRATHGVGCARSEGEGVGDLEGRVHVERLAEIGSGTVEHVVVEVDICSRGQPVRG